MLLVCWEGSGGRGVCRNMVQARGSRRNRCGKKMEDGKEREEKNTEDGDVFQQALILRSCQLIQILCVPGCQARQTRR